jgi:hypothetical protein
VIFPGTGTHPGHRYAAAPMRITLLALLCLLAGAMTASSAAAAGVDETCSLSVVKVDPNALNVAYPDAAAIYYEVSYVGTPGMQMEIDGIYPHARYMSFTTYDGVQRPLAALNDSQIAPDPGSSDPFLAGARRDTAAAQRHYTAVIQFGAKPPNPAPNTIYTGTGQNGAPNLQGSILYRIYIPDQGRDDTGGVGLPTVTLEPVGSRNSSPSSPCTGALSPTSIVNLNSQVATANGVPALEGDGSTFGYDPPRWQKFINVAYAVTQLGTGNPGAQRVVAPLDGPLDSTTLQAGGSGGFLSNLDNAYVAAPIDRNYGQILVTRMHVASFADTRAGTAIMPAPQLRYWSMCENDPYTERYIACATDDQTAQRPRGYATFVVSTPAQRPPNATAACGVNWLPWGADPRGVLIMRNMLPAASFPQSIQNATLGHEAQTMGDYFPASRYFSASEFASLGCTGAAGAIPEPGSRSGGAAGSTPCPAATGRLTGVSLGAVKLGMSRARLRKLFPRYANHGRRFMDYLCLTPNPIRVAYASPALLRRVGVRERRQERGRVVLALTANRHYRLREVAVGTRAGAAARRLRAGKPYHVGLNYWYLAPNGASTAVLKVRHGAVQEIGIANKRLTASRRLARLFLRSFF